MRDDDEACKSEMMELEIFVLWSGQCTFLRCCRWRGGGALLGPHAN